MLFSFFVFSNFFGQLKFGGYFVIAIKFAEVQNSKKHRARSHFRPHHTDSRHKFRFVRGTTIVLGSSKQMWCLPSASIRLFECPNRGFQFLKCFFPKPYFTFLDVISPWVRSVNLENLYFRRFLAKILHFRRLKFIYWNERSVNLLQREKSRKVVVWNDSCFRWILKPASFEMKLLGPPKSLCGGLSVVRLLTPQKFRTPQISGVCSVNRFQRKSQFSEVLGPLRWHFRLTLMFLRKWS